MRTEMDLLVLEDCLLWKSEQLGDDGDEDCEPNRNSTDEDHARTLAGTLFDEVVAPLAKARRVAGTRAYFPLADEAGVRSYYEKPIIRVMQSADCEFTGGGTAEGLIDALAASWTAEGEADLAAMAPRRKAIAEALHVRAAESDGSVSILCYTMF